MTEEREQVNPAAGEWMHRNQSYRIKRTKEK
jgi:hypothetical protein